MLVVGEKMNARLPWALGAIAVAIVLAAASHLAHHGVTELGSVHVGPPEWRLHWLTLRSMGGRAHDLGDPRDRDPLPNGGDVENGGGRTRR